MGVAAQVDARGQPPAAVEHGRHQVQLKKTATRSGPPLIGRAQ